MNRPFYFIRHGETDWNRQQKLQGHSDIPLNSLGRTQAESLIEFVRNLQNPISIYSSDLKRAAETAKIAAPHLQAVYDPRLREVHLGDAEGSHRDNLETDFGPDIVKAWSSNDEDSLTKRFPNGESRREAIDRVLTLLREFSPRMKSESLIFFAHGLLMRSLAETALLTASSADLNRLGPNLRAPNCSVFEFEWKDSGPILRQIIWLCES